MNCLKCDREAGKGRRGYCNSHYEEWRKNRPDRPRCPVDGCASAVVAKGYCHTHYHRARRGSRMDAPVKSIRRAYEVRARDVNGNKKCFLCEQWLPTSQFHASKRSADLLRSECMDCAKYKCIEQKYALTREAYEAIIDRQGGGCRVCGSTDDLVVDHDHSCCDGYKSCGACVRSVLCRKCNVILGLTGDDPVRLHKLAEYLADSTISKEIPTK